VYVSFAEAPESLDRYHPEHYHELRGARNVIYGLTSDDSSGLGPSSTMKGAYSPPAAYTDSSSTSIAYSHLPIIDDEEQPAHMIDNSHSLEESVTF